MFKIARAVFGVGLMMLFFIGVDAVSEQLHSPYVPRAARAAHSIVGIFVDRPLGLSGWVFWLLVTGAGSLAMVGSVVARRPKAVRTTRAEPRAVAESGPANRRRQLAPASAAEAVAPASAAEEAAPLDNEPIDFAALYHLDRVSEPLPAWRLVDAAPDAAMSWIGGLPCAPAGFEWPTSSAGRPMVFLAQIDLTGVSVPGLAGRAVLLFFLDAPPDVGWVYAVRTLSREELAASARVGPPPGAATPRDLGWFHDEATLPATPVSLEAYVDADSSNPVSKLFGVEVEDGFGFNFPDGYRNVLYVRYDASLGTASEHWHGMSIACPGADLERGILDTGKAIGMHNG